MLKLMVKLDHHRKFNIPIPYTLLYASCAIISSKILWKAIFKIVNHNKVHPIPHIMPPNRELLFQLLKEIKNYKGLPIIDIVADDHEIIIIS